MEIVLGAGVVQVVVALYLFYGSHSKNRTNKFLYLLLIVSVLHFSIKSILYLVLKDQFLFNNLITLFAYGYGMLFFLYVVDYCHVTLQKNRKSYKNHIIPFLIVVLLYIVTITYFSFTRNLNFLIVYRKIVILPTSLLLNFYFILSFIKLRKFEKESPEIKVRIKTFKLICYLFFLLTPATLLVNAFFKDGTNSEILMRFSGYIFFIIAIVLITKHHFRYPVKDIYRVNKEKNSRYQNSGLPLNEIEDYAKKLDDLMSDKRIYLNSNLTLDDLAKNLKLPKHYITEILSTHFKQNFYQYVNSYRINAVIKKLENDPNTPVIDIALACGFNSKSSFNNYFKNITGQTPKEFRLQLKENTFQN